MKRAIIIVVGLVLVAGCGDNLAAPGPLAYSDPPSGGKLRLIQDPSSTGWDTVLDLVVGDQALTGYSVGFDLPIVHHTVQLGQFTPGTALSAGTAPTAAMATLPDKGPLADMLVTGQSQKASGPGAVTTDTSLAPGTVLYSIHLVPVGGAKAGIVFDGTAASFVLPSGGLRDRTATAVVDAKDVAIGKLELTRDN